MSRCVYKQELNFTVSIMLEKLLDDIVKFVMLSAILTGSIKMS